METGIKWRKQDYSNLRKAINEFNKKVKELEQLGLENLPKQINYKDEKADIYTRKEFNRRLNEIRKFQNKNQSKFVTLESGEIMTRWEKNVLENARNRAERRLTKELMEVENDISIGMGNKKANEIRATLDSFAKLGKVIDKRLKDRVTKSGKSDNEFRKAAIYQQNFINAYKHMKGKYSRKIVEYAKSFNNPIEFWNEIKGTPLADLKERYDSTEGMIYLGIAETEIREYYMKELRYFVNFKL